MLPPSLAEKKEEEAASITIRITQAEAKYAGLEDRFNQVDRAIDVLNDDLKVLEKLKEKVRTKKCDIGGRVLVLIVLLVGFAFVIFGHVVFEGIEAKINEIAKKMNELWLERNGFELGENQ